MHASEDIKYGGLKETPMVVVPATAGSAHMKASRESVKKGSPSMVRLYWQESEDEQTVASPTGQYIVINYWLYRKSGEDRWMVTGTNVDGCTEIDIAEGEESYLDLGAKLYGSFTSTPNEGKHRISFFLHDFGGNRLTLSKNGRVIMPGYRILDEGGKVLAEGIFDII